MPTLEEVNDDELELEFDEGDFDDFTPFANQPNSAQSSNGPARLVPAAAKKPTPAPAPASAPSPAQQQLTQEDMPFLPAGLKASDFKHAGTNDGTVEGPDGTKYLNPTSLEQFKDWEVMYPVYFNIDRSHSEGRRVPVDCAVENPVAQTMVEALKSLNVPAVLEPERSHPKDWANPGRVRYLLKDDDLVAERAKYNSPEINSARHLYKLVGQYMKAHPTNQDTPKRSPVYGQLREMMHAENSRLPGDKRKTAAEVDRSISFTPKAIPKGWEKKKIGTVLLPNSPALSFMAMDGEDIASQMAQGMLGGLPGGMPGGGMPGGAPEVPPAVPKQKAKKVFIRR